MTNYIPFIGWILSFIGNVSLAVPFYIIWTYCGIGRKFFAEYLPVQFIELGFWNIVGLFMCFAILRSFSPFIVTSNSTSGKRD